MEGTGRNDELSMGREALLALAVNLAGGGCRGRKRNTEHENEVGSFQW